MFFRWLEDGANTVYHGGYDDLKRFTKCDVCQFICKEEKEFSQCTVILISALLHCNHEEASKHNRYVCGQRIIRQAVAFCNQLQVGLTGLEKHLDLPAFPINPNDLFFGKIRVCTDKSNPVLLILLVADTDNLCRNLLFLSNCDVYRKQIFAAATAFLTDAENLLMESCSPS